MQSKSHTRTAIGCVALLVVWVLVLANWRHPVLRVSEAYSNDFALWVCLLFPWIAAAVALVGLRGRARWIVFVPSLGAMAVGLLPLLALSLGLLIDGPRGGGPTPLQHFPLPSGGELVVYDAGCGAPCGLEFRVVQERAIAPGLLVVRVLYDGADFDAAWVEALSPDRVRIGPRTVRVRPWVYP